MWNENVIDCIMRFPFAVKYLLNAMKCCEIIMLLYIEYHRKSDEYNEYLGLVGSLGISMLCT